MSAPTERKWIIRRERGDDGQIRPWHGWIVTAPSGNRRWFMNWSMLVSWCPMFAMGESSPALRDECPHIFDAGVPIPGPENSWRVLSYPDGDELHRDTTYEAADQWRRANNDISFIVPILDRRAVGSEMRRMYLQSDYDNPEEFLASITCPDNPAGLT